MIVRILRKPKFNKQIGILRTEKKLIQMKKINFNFNFNK